MIYEYADYEDHQDTLTTKLADKQAAAIMRKPRVGFDAGILMLGTIYGVPVYVESLLRELLEPELLSELAGLQIVSGEAVGEMRRRLVKRGLSADRLGSADVQLVTQKTDDYKLSTWVEERSDSALGRRVATAADVRLLRSVYRTMPPAWKRASPVDVFHHTDYRNGYWAQLPCPHVVTIHDLIPVKFADQCSDVWKRHAGDTFQFVRERGAHVITYSESTRRDLMEYVGLPRDQISVIPLAVRPGVVASVDETAKQAVLEKFALKPGRFVFALGRIDPLKNLERLIRAFRLIADIPELSDVKLVLAGPKSGAHSEAGAFDPDAIARECGVADRVLRTGYVSDQELSALMATCGCFAYPTLYEGFGLPVLEAMVQGAPIIASNVSSVPEATGEAAVLVDPYDLDAIADGMRRVMTDPELARTLVEKGRRHVTGFSWRKVAQQHVEVYRQVAARQSVSV